jgi:hypothetical protein
MRRAFVLQLGPETKLVQCQFASEEVDTGRELRVRSTEELLAFSSQCFELAQYRERASHDIDES